MNNVPLVCNLFHEREERVSPFDAIIRLQTSRLLVISPNESLMRESLLVRTLAEYELFAVIDEMGSADEMRPSFVAIVKYGELFYRTKLLGQARVRNLMIRPNTVLAFYTRR